MALIEEKFPCSTNSSARIFRPPNATAGIHTSAELHQDPGTFDGRSTNCSTWPRLYYSSWFDWQSGQRTSVRRIIGLEPRLEGRNSLFVPKLHENQNEEHTHSKKLSCKKYLLFFTSVVKKFLIWNNNTYVLAKPFYCPNQRPEGECIINGWPPVLSGLD